jgi:hypothetical protein
VTRSIVAGGVVGVAAGLLVLLAADTLLLPRPPAVTVAVAREAGARDADARTAVERPRGTWAAELIRPESDSAPTPGPHAQGVAPGRDGHRAMRAVLEAHQPGLSEWMRPVLDKALFTEASDRCGIDLARRKRMPWMLNGMLAVDLQIRGGQAVVTDVFFPPEHQAWVGDEAFRTCFRNAVAGTRFACDCKSGDLTAPYPVNLRHYHPSHGTDAGP